MLSLLRMALAYVKKSFKDYTIYFVTAALSFGIFYAFNSIDTIMAGLNISDTNQKIIALVNDMIGLLSLFISLFILFLIVYSERFLFKRRSKEFGLYLILGMQKRHLAFIIACEQIITLIVSCLAGFVLGQLFSQTLVQVASYLFRAPADISFVILSSSALIKTLALFALAFFISLLLNVIYLWSQPIIKLLKAKRFVQRSILSKPLILFVLFILSLGGIALSYALLANSGIDPTKSDFIAATMLVVISTAAFFFSSLSALIVIIKALPQLYYKGIRSFTLRQLSAQINSHFISLTAITCALFLALSSTGMGLSFMNMMNSMLTINDAWDLSFEASVPNNFSDLEPSLQKAAENQASQKADNFPEVLKDKLLEHGFDTAKDFSESFVLKSYSVNKLSLVQVSDDAHINLFSMAQFLPQEYRETLKAEFIPRSRMDDFLRESHLPALTQDSNDVILLVNNQKEADSFNKELESAPAKFTLQGSTYNLSHTVAVAPLTFTGGLSIPRLIVPDAAIPSDALLASTYINARYASPDKEKHYAELLSDKEGAEVALGPLFADEGIIVSGITKQMLLDLSFGTNAGIGFIALYIASILIVVTGAILSLQQLTQTLASRSRYQALSELGASRSQIYTSIVVESLVLYLLPLGVAAVHSSRVFAALNSTIKDAGLGSFDIYSGLEVFGLAFLSLYILYWVLCLVSSISLVKNALENTHSKRSL